MPEFYMIIAEKYFPDLLSIEGAGLSPRLTSMHPLFSLPRRRRRWKAGGARASKNSGKYFFGQFYIKLGNFPAKMM